MRTTDRADLDSEWQRKGGTISDKTARQEFGLTQDEIIQAIRAEELRHRESSIHGNPWLRLLRQQVEALAREKHGDRYLKNQRALARVTRELKRLRSQVTALEERKSRLIAEIGK